MVCVSEQNNGNKTMKVGLGAGMGMGPCIPASSNVYWHLTSTLILTVHKLFDLKSSSLVDGSEVI